jgi:hypothetical protein
MDRNQVSSSNVSSVGYDPATQTLEVEFSNGNVYQYFDVPEPVYQQLIQAASLGAFLNGNIKGSYRYARL